MGKHENTPPFSMIVERGRLVPATQFDAERLDTWRNGSKVNVIFVRHGSRVMERKWWAVLNRAVKECKTPWNTSSEASEAIKLALGIVNLSKTVGGAWLQYPKSLTELTDPELSEAVEQMVEIIHRVTGVDPDTWHKEIANVGENEPETSAASTDAGSGETVHSSDGAAADLSAQTGDEGEAEQIEAGDGPAVSSASSDLSDEQLSKLFLLEECAERMIEAATYQVAAERSDRLDKARMAWLSELPDDKEFVQNAYKACARLIENPGGRDQAMPFLKDQARKWMGVAA